MCEPCHQPGVSEHRQYRKSSSSVSSRSAQENVVSLSPSLFSIGRKSGSP